MTTTPIFDQVHQTWPARDTDPSTSHAAVPTKRTVALVQVRILSILEEHGPCTHDEIHDWYVIRHGFVTEQNVRTRTSELAKSWRVIPLDREGRTLSGRRAVRWAVKAS